MTMAGERGIRRPPPTRLLLCGRELLLHRGDRRRLVREAAVAEELPEDPDLLLRGDELALEEDVELPRAADGDLDLRAGRLLDLRGETRRFFLVPSGSAVEDLHVGHG
ncbi:MAG TPA: hypothetical protein VHF22_15860 [Planctomycetota bacterium]|nr:hypothetical protein [Planctomycetota bacterium]